MSASPEVKRQHLGSLIYSEGRNAFSGTDAILMEKRITSVASAWQSRLKLDPAVDIEDLLQDLRIRYWSYWRDRGHPKYTNTIRDWARSAMRAYGYCGRPTSLLSNARIERELSVSRYRFPGSDELSDEDILDSVIVGALALGGCGMRYSHAAQREMVDTEMAFYNRLKSTGRKKGSTRS